jgi:hypothetical protein
VRLGCNARKIGQGSSGGRCEDYGVYAAVSGRDVLSTASWFH